VSGSDGVLQLGLHHEEEDLPPFVYNRLEAAVAGPNSDPVNGNVHVKMETPVLYFYAPRPVTASARVIFRNGFMTEWYPQAISDAQTLEWKNIQVLPGAEIELPASKGDSHYFAARETDAAPIRVGTEREKLLFYRGTGDFQPPARPRFTASGAVEIRGNVGTAILFENRGGSVGWRRVADQTNVARPELTGDVAALRTELVAMLTEAGLYQKEAQAMVETWRDSWFEEGLRLLYVAPLEFVERTLPLEVTPHPREIARVFMGRVEMLAPERREALTRSMETGGFADAASYGRFFSAFARQVAKPSTPPESMKYVAAQELKATVRGCVE
jgi:hypothetical protein